MTRWQKARRLSAAFLHALGLTVFLAGIAILGYAAFQWMQTAHWEPLTVGQALASRPATRDWVAHPRTWLGLHRVVGWALRVPVFLIVTLLGAAMFIVSAPAEPRRTSES